MGWDSKRDGVSLDRRRALQAGAVGASALTSGCLGVFSLLGDGTSPPGVFHALDLDDGSTRWTRTVDNAIQSAASVSDGTVYLGADDGYLRALSTDDGSQRWAFDTADPAFENNSEAAAAAFVTTDVAVGTGGVYAGTDQAGFVGVDAETGEKRWRIRLESPYEEQMVSTMRSTPAVAGDTVAFGTGTDADRAYGVDAASGQGRWKLETRGRVEAGPTAHGDRFYVVDNLGGVYALSTDGEVHWKREVGGLSGGSPAVGADRVFVGSDEGVHALDAATGEELWTTSATSHWIDSRPAVGDGTVYAVSRSGTVVAFATDDGAERWTADVGAHASTSPALADGTVVAGDRNGRVVALHADDGSERWVVDTEETVTATPVVADGSVYVGTK